MMRIAFMLFLFAIAIPAEAGWNSLWLNPDQRGEALLQQGDASAAAKIYKDPKRKAYAEMKAGDFKQAASDLGNLHDSDSDYNRGNALAKTGDLKGALDAYDAALKSDPGNQDARHNRDLVANALKQKSLQQNSGQQNSGQQKSGGKQQDGRDDKSGGKQDNKPGSGSNGQGKQGSQSGKTGGNPAGGQNASVQQNTQPGSSEIKTQQNPQKNPGQHGSDANSAAQPGQGQSGESAASQQQAGNSENHTGQQSSPMKPGLSPDETAQARQDAAASLAANTNKHGATGNDSADTTAAPADQTAPLSEQQLSKEQWLRSIPDDPGGLLRRKFMIEYMLRQQKAQQ